MKKRICSFLFLAVLFIVLIAPDIQAASTTMMSGNLGVASPTKSEIQAKWNALKDVDASFKVEPSVVAPYKAGKPSDAFLKSGVSYLNYIRYVAHLPAVRLDATLTEDAQYGAVLLAAKNELNHYPEKPSNMSQAFYERGRSATSSSNIACGYPTLISATQGFMNDDDMGNIVRVGHRRWLLNPGLYNVGYGYAETVNGYPYITTKVFDESGKKINYDFVSWPSSGNFPNNIFRGDTPWSVSLNLGKYDEPDLSKVKVTLTRESDGKTWTFDSRNNKPDYYKPYFNVDDAGCGIANCIIFRPSSSDIGVYKGVYTVKITGITTMGGTAATLTYKVNFFDINGKYLDIVKQPKTVSVKRGETAKVTVKAMGEGVTYTWYVKDSGETKFSKSAVTGPSYSVKMDATRKNRAVYCVVKDKYGKTQKSNVVYLRMLPTITAQPKTVYAKYGSTAKVTIKASGEGLKYIWYTKNPGDSKFVKSSVTGASYSLKMDNTRKNRAVYCVVKDKYGNTVKSKTVYFRMSASIITQPKTVYAKNGAAAKVTVKAAGDGLTYTWYKKDVGETKFTKSAVTKSSYSMGMDSSRKNRAVYCVVKDKYGKTVKSKTVYLRMAVTITSQPKSVAVKSGATAKVTVKAVGDGLTYTWYVKNPGESTYAKTSVKTSTYSIKMDKIRNNRSVYCVVKDKYGKTAKSSVAVLRMK